MTPLVYHDQKPLRLLSQNFQIDLNSEHAWFWLQIISPLFLCYHAWLYSF